MPSPSYQEALGVILNAGDRGMKPGLDRTQAMLHALGDPHHGHRGVLVAGSNGKGSVCALLDSVSRAAGLRTVTLVKPHLLSYRERVLIDGEPITEEEFADHVGAIDGVLDGLRDSVGEPTQFELLTVLGALAARRHQPDVVVCEVGLGGRLDSTNVWELGVAVVVSVSLEHCDRLGDTVVEIATEKAAIVKPGNAVVTGVGGDGLAPLRERAAAVGAASVRVLGENLTVEGVTRGAAGSAAEVRTGGLEVAVHTPLIGAFQLDNLGVAVGAVAALRELGLVIPDAAVRQGCAAVRWPGRLQWVDGDPPLILDAAHNPAAVAAIVPAVGELVAGRDIVLLFGAMRDKEVGPMLASLRELTGTAVFTQPATPRALVPADLGRAWGTGARAVSSLPDAITTARLLAGRHGVVLVCGSIYLIGDLMRLL